MKFAYIDESGSTGQGDVFVMAGLLIDAMRLRKLTSEFDLKLSRILNSVRDSGTPSEFKTSNFVRDKGIWGVISQEKKEHFLQDICETITKPNQGGKILAYGISYKKFQSACKTYEGLPKNQDQDWVACSMYIASLIQKEMMSSSKNKGLTVLIFDEHSLMKKLSSSLYKPSEWYDGLYSQSAIKDDDKRFDQIVNCGFSIHSEHSSLIQVADMLSFIYRKFLEDKQSTWEIDYGKLYGLLDSKRLKTYRRSSSPSVEFYKMAKHDTWEI